MLAMRGRHAAAALLALGVSIGARRPRPPAPPPPPGSLCAAPTDARPEPAPASPDRPDWLLAQHRYVDLAAWLAAPHASPGIPPATLTYVRGVLANKQNRNAASIADLEPLLARLDPVADTARRHVVLETLADDYFKTYRYGDAARMLERLEREQGSAMKPDDRTDVHDEYLLRRALRNAPPERTSVSAPFAIPLERDALGLREVTVHVGRDASGWIFDTGANLSTIVESMARRLGLRVTTTGSTTRGVTGANVPSRVAVIPEMRIGAARVTNVVVLVLPDSALDIPQAKFQITAILGYPVLESLGRLAIGADSLGVDPVAGEAVSDSSNLFLDHLSPVVAATVGDSTRLFHFDSGADAAMLTVRFCRAYESLLAGLDTTHLQIGGAGGVQRFAGYRIPRLPVVIGGRPAELDSAFVLRDASNSPFESYYGNLPGTFAARYGGYTLDFRAMTFRLGARSR